MVNFFVFFALLPFPFPSSSLYPQRQLSCSYLYCSLGSWFVQIFCGIVGESGFLCLFFLLLSSKFLLRPAFNLAHSHCILHSTNSLGFVMDYTLLSSVQWTQNEPLLTIQRMKLNVFRRNASYRGFCVRQHFCFLSFNAHVCTYVEIHKELDAEHSIWLHITAQNCIKYVMWLVFCCRYCLMVNPLQISNNWHLYRSHAPDSKKQWTRTYILIKWTEQTPSSICNSNEHVFPKTLIFGWHPIDNIFIYVCSVWYGVVWFGNIGNGYHFHVCHATPHTHTLTLSLSLKRRANKANSTEIIDTRSLGLTNVVCFQFYGEKKGLVSLNFRLGLCAIILYCTHHTPPTQTQTHIFALTYSPVC